MHQIKLTISPTYNSPEVEFDPLSGVLKLTGKSIPENATQVYAPILGWVKEYVKDSCEETNLHLDLDYFNTASSIWIARMVKLLTRIPDPEKLLILHIYFHIEEFNEMEEEDIKEALAPVFNVISEATLSVGVKIYGKDDFNTIVKEKLILF